MSQHPIRLLHTEAEREAAIVEYERRFDNEPATDSADADRFELLGLVTSKYEPERFSRRGALRPWMSSASPWTSKATPRPTSPPF